MKDKWWPSIVFRTWDAAKEAGELLSLSSYFGAIFGFLNRRPPAGAFLDSTISLAPTRTPHVCAFARLRP